VNDVTMIRSVIQYEALRLFHDDDLVFLPKDEVLRRIRQLSKLLGDADRSVNI